MSSLTVDGLIPNLPSPSTRLYSITAKRPESASVARTRTMVVPKSTFSNTGSYKQEQKNKKTLMQYKA